MNAKISESVTADISLNTSYTTNNRNTLKGSSTETEDLMARALYLTPVAGGATTEEYSSG